MLLLREALRSSARCAYGRAAERRALDEWNIVAGDEEQITRSTGVSYLHVPWFEGVSLKGALDGWMGQRVVEFKFRTGKFATGGTLRESELLQVQAYMFMTSTQSAILIEGVCKRETLILRHREILFDQKLWQKTTDHARRLVHLQHELTTHELFRSAYFGLSLENQVRLVESVLLPHEPDELQERAAKRCKAKYCT
jgi:hypothetical protein